MSWKYDNLKKTVDNLYYRVSELEYKYKEIADMNRKMYAILHYLDCVVVEEPDKHGDYYLHKIEKKDD